MRVFKTDKSSQEGTALVLTLWLLALISALALSFALSARTGSAITRNFKESVMLRAKAVEAIENSIAYLLADPDPLIDYIDGDGKFRTDRERPPVSGILESGDVSVYLSLSAEDSRININDAEEPVLRGLFEIAGAKEEDTAAMVASLMDWKDPDDLHRLGGAEDDHYMPMGYETSGRPLETPEELILIKGFNKEMVRGDNSVNKGLSGMITTFSHTINFNSANSEVMKALGLDLVRANSLISERTGNDGLDLAALKQYLPQRLFKIATPFSNMFRLEAQASLEGSPQVYHITTIIKRVSAQGKQELKTIYWKENIEAGRT